jgi:G3E family GTPase
MIPITIFTGFLGSGKTTILKKLIAENPEKKFGLIVNEFGEIGIDGQILYESGQEMIEISNGCMCCIVRTDLYDTVEKLIATNKVDYILIEASGLAEAKPIAETFVMNDLGGKVRLDAIICTVDVDNYNLTTEIYNLALEQLQYCDIAVINKISSTNKSKVKVIENFIHQANPAASILTNEDNNLSTKLLIDQEKWSNENLIQVEHSHTHAHEHTHSHTHNAFQEIVYISEKDVVFDPNKLDTWLKTELPISCVRAKGFINIAYEKGSKYFLFQMIGASKSITQLKLENGQILENTKLVFIGKEMDQEKLINDLSNCLM